MKNLDEALEYIKQLESALESQKEVADSNIRRFFIPTIGTLIKTVKDTPCRIFFECRNHKFMEKVKGKYQRGFDWEEYAGKKNPVLPPEWAKYTYRDISYYVLSDDPKNPNNYIRVDKIRKEKVWYCEWIIPKDTILKVDRIYIRKGKDMKEFDSITFCVQKQKGSKLTGRFWLKREDVNELVVEVVKETP